MRWKKRIYMKEEEEKKTVEKQYPIETEVCSLKILIKLMNL